MKKFGLTQSQYEWLKKVLATFLPQVKIYVFGSRARGDYKRYSDLDLAIESQNPIPRKTLLELEEQFAESSLPFKVDLVELCKIDPAFKTNIQSDLNPL